jgi:hypothetical protein
LQPRGERTWHPQPELGLARSAFGDASNRTARARFNSLKSAATDIITENWQQITELADKLPEQEAPCEVADEDRR